MYRGTTAVITLNITTTLDLNSISNLSVTFESKNGTKQRIYGLNDVAIDEENHKIIVSMSQEDTLMFSVGKIRVQLKLKLNNGKVYASNIKETTMNEILDERVI